MESNRQIRMKSINKIIRFILSSIIKLDNVQNILELGAGTKSTKEIRATLKEKKSGFCTSLEDKDFWYNLVSNYVINDEFGEIVLSKLIYEKNCLKYDYKTDKKFDLIFIDGPAVDKTNQYELSLLNKSKQRIKNEKITIPIKLKGGTSSVDILEYVLPFCHRDTIICVDKRRKAVYYYLKKYYNDFRFYGYNSTGNDKYLSKMKFSSMKDKFVPMHLTVILNKNSKNLEAVKKIFAKNNLTLYRY